MPEGLRYGFDTANLFIYNPKHGAPGTVDVNSFDVTSSAIGFAVDVVIHHPGVTQTRIVCFSIEAVDGVGDTGFESALVVIMWN